MPAGSHAVEMEEMRDAILRGDWDMTDRIVESLTRRMVFAIHASDEESVGALAVDVERLYSKTMAPLEEHGTAAAARLSGQLRAMVAALNIAAPLLAAPKLDEVLAEAGGLLAAIGDGEASASAVAKNLGLDKMTLAYRIGLLQESGLVALRMSGREIFVRLTDAGLAHRPAAGRAPGA